MQCEIPTISIHVVILSQVKLNIDAEHTRPRFFHTCTELSLNLRHLRHLHPAVRLPTPWGSARLFGSLPPGHSAFGVQQRRALELQLGHTHQTISCETMGVSWRPWGSPKMGGLHGLFQGKNPNPKLG